MERPLNHGHGSTKCAISYYMELQTCPIALRWPPTLSIPMKITTNVISVLLKKTNIYHVVSNNELKMYYKLRNNVKKITNNNLSSACLPLMLINHIGERKTVKP